MRDPARIERVCNKLKELWIKHPDLRFGQIVSLMYSPWAIPGEQKFDPFYIEDDISEEIIENLGVIMEKGMKGYLVAIDWAVDKDGEG